MVLLGTRPEIVKMAPLIALLQKDSRFHLDIVNTGQHYDIELSKIFFDNLKVPRPLADLKVGSGTHATQTGRIMIAMESILLKNRPDLILAEGDTNTVMAAALAAVKVQIPFGHVEAGLRSFDRTMPEELNRIVADHCSELLLAPTPRAATNLLLEGCNPSTIHITGNTVVDAVLQNKARAIRTSKMVKVLGLVGESFAVVTLHRPANVDNAEALSPIITGLLQLEEIKLVLPLHPRTEWFLKQSGLLNQLQSAPHIILTKPLGYLDFLRLMIGSQIIITDSGGLQEEALTLGKPCVTLRTNTERPESVLVGANFLVGRSTELIVNRVRQVLTDPSIQERISNLSNPFGDGSASKRSVDAIVEFCEQGGAFIEPQFLQTGTKERVLHPVNAKLVEKSVSGVEAQLGGKIILIFDSEGHPEYPFPHRSFKKNEWFILSDS